MPARILVVEDSPVIQRLIEMTLRPAGYEVAFCASGIEGLERAQIERPDLLILDIGLPGMGGWEVLEALRADEETKNMPVMVLTAHGRSNVQDEADLKGANMALSKPFDPADFREAVAGLTQSQAA